MTPTSLTEVINHKTPSVSVIRRDHGELQAKAFLTDNIIDLAQFFNVARNMNSHQVIQTVEIILQDFYYLTMLDFKFFFYKVKRGDYGKLYSSLDGSVIITYLREYDVERTQEYINHRQQQDKRRELDVKNGDPAGVEKYIKILKDLVKSKTPLQEKPKKEIPPEQIMVNRWLKQFDNLFYRYGKKYGGERYLEIGRSRMNVNEFLNIKFKNNGK